MTRVVPRQGGRTTGNEDGEKSSTFDGEEPPCVALYSPPSNSMSASSSSSDNFSKLPKGWEMRVDGQGRIFYIDHIRQKTAWTPPCILEALEESEYLNKNCENICDENRFIRQTMEFSKNNINNNLTIPQTPKQMALNILLSKELFNRLLHSNNVS
uniref:WW domain-containing protein n=1 Tax=Meloidogyne incognita TaxID=6306 RepID=A0A914MHI9_MELIC